MLRSVATLSVAATLGLLTGMPATAHTSLVGSTPEDGSTVDTELTTIELVFDGAIQAQFSQVAVLDADENPYQAGDPVVDENIVTQAVDDLPDGTYTISYRIVSADGHPVPGTVKFTVAVGGSTSTDDADDASGSEPTSGENAPTTPDRTAPERSSDATPAATTGPGGGLTGTSAGGLIIVALLAGLGLLTLRNRRKMRNTPWLGDDDPGRGDSTTP